MKEFIAQRAVRHNGKLYKEGDVLLLEDKYAAPLLKNGAVIAYSSDSPKKDIVLPDYSIISAVIAAQYLTIGKWNDLSDAERNSLILEHLTPKDQDDAESQGLIGSSKLPSVIDFNGAQVALGDIVAGAFAQSGLTASKWNRLSVKARDEILSAYIAGAK